MLTVHIWDELRIQQLRPAVERILPSRREVTLTLEPHTVVISATLRKCVLPTLNSIVLHPYRVSISKNSSRRVACK